jgi:hypothetical protein
VLLLPDEPAVLITSAADADVACEFDVKMMVVSFAAAGDAQEVVVVVLVLVMMMLWIGCVCRCGRPLQLSLGRPWWWLTTASWSCGCWHT